MITLASFLSPDETAIPDEWMWERIRNWRDTKLNESDWTQVIDSPVDVEAWGEYRQLLRDLPDSAATPQDVVFPVAP